MKITASKLEIKSVENFWIGEWNGNRWRRGLSPEIMWRGCLINKVIFSNLSGGSCRRQIQIKPHNTNWIEILHHSVFNEEKILNSFTSYRLVTEIPFYFLPYYYHFLLNKFLFNNNLFNNLYIQINDNKRSEIITVIKTYEKCKWGCRDLEMRKSNVL